jgi:D-aspartate ligase
VSVATIGLSGNSVPAVVVGGTLNSLGVVRSLALGGVPIYLLDTSRRCPAAWSRHCRFVRTPSLDGRSFIESLVSLAAQLGDRPVLILTSDESVVSVSAERERLEPLYRLVLPSIEMVNSLADKSAFHALADREGFPVPRSVCVSREADLLQIRALTPPLIIKPADKVLVLNGYVERAVRADTVAAGELAAATMLPRAPRLIVQEWIDGPDTEIFFTLFTCDRQSRVIGLFSGRKLICSPPAVGSTALCIAAPEVAEPLSALTLHFIARTRYQGLGSLEFKRDSRTAQFIIIEPTVGRTDWQEEIATLCGTNLPLLAYRSAVDLPELSPAARPQESFAWRSSKEFRVPPMPHAPKLRIVDGYLRWSDPLPAVYYYAYERFMLRVWRRVAAGRAS